jgi:hypothetical protein
MYFSQPPIGTAEDISQAQSPLHDSPLKLLLLLVPPLIALLQLGAWWRPH